jgi:peptidoglycan/LPS O-acetylase OafA/YrhL
VFGYFRLFLATLVMLSHIGITLQGFNPGVSAVVSFYMLAGFVVGNLFTKIFISRTPFYLKFYYERAVRIFPLYLYIISLTIVFILITSYGDAKFSFLKLVNNILVVPLNYYMVINSSILTNPEGVLVPPAWSLGLELQAYLILPYIIFYKPVKLVLGIISLAIFILANIGIINTDYFGYRLLPGILFVFILGLTTYRNTQTSSSTDLFDKYFPSITYAALLLLLIYLGISSCLCVPYTRETICGILIGLPIITFCANSQIKAPINHILGDLSYGIFLSHFLAMWLITNYSLVDKYQYQYLYVFMVFCISLTISAVGVFLVETKFKKYRFKFSLLSS